MKDRLGRFLVRWRQQVVLPHVTGRLLDIGCGQNALCRLYSGDAIGVDVYPWDGVDRVVADTAALPFENESFDTVTIVAALNHIPNRSEVLIEARRVLRPTGRLVVTMLRPMVSRAWHWLRRPWDADQTERGLASGEVFGLTRSQMHRLLTDAGYRVVCERRFMLGMNHLTIAERA
ncbi:MAG: class I SAM-dependent methyltransferase [Planctomycetota bacterium]